MKTKLPKIFKRKWLAALRSGEFKQGRSKLHNDQFDTYCCLGVGCYVAGHKIVDGEGYSRRLDYPKIPVVLDHDACCKTKEGQSITRVLAGLNDKGNSFDKIANWIEKNL